MIPAAGSTDMDYSFHDPVPLNNMADVLLPDM